MDQTKATDSNSWLFNHCMVSSEDVVTTEIARNERVTKLIENYDILIRTEEQMLMKGNDFTVKIVENVERARTGRI